MNHSDVYRENNEKSEVFARLARNARHQQKEEMLGKSSVSALNRYASIRAFPGRVNVELLHKIAEINDRLAYFQSLEILTVHHDQAGPWVDQGAEIFTYAKRQGVLRLDEVESGAESHLRIFFDVPEYWQYDTRHEMTLDDENNPQHPWIKKEGVVIMPVMMESPDHAGYKFHFPEYWCGEKKIQEYLGERKITLPE